MTSSHTFFSLDVRVLVHHESVLHFTLNLLATRETVDIEDLVDDFATFYIAGESLEDKGGYSYRGSSPLPPPPPKKKKKITVSPR